METEPEGMDPNAGMPSSRMTMVPLRDASSPTQTWNQNGRGRGSQLGTARSKRCGTPSYKPGRGRSRRQSVTDLNITVLGDDGDSDDWAKKKSTRKRKPTPRKPQPALGQTDDAGIQRLKSPKPKRQTRGAAKSVEIREDTDAEEDGADAAVDSDSPELRSIDLNRVSVRPRSMSSKQRPANFAIQDVEASNEATDDAATSAGDEQLKNVLVISTNYPTPDPSVQDDQEIYEPPPSLPDDCNANFDTILESEGFTMIDLESIPSARHFFSSQPETQGMIQALQSVANLENHHLSPDTKRMDQVAPHSTRPIKTVRSALPAYLTEGESDISSNVPSSPPVLSRALRRITDPLLVETRSRNVTPQVYSSPKLPSLPRAVQPTKAREITQLRKSTPPSLAKVVKAGIALQGVLSPKTSKQLPSSPCGTPEERLNSLFEGFDSSIRRELRAGLRFGEELAKRQRSSPDVGKPKSPGMKSEPEAARTQVWRGEPLMQHTPAQQRAIESKATTMTEKNIGKQNVGPNEPLVRTRSSLCQETKLTSSPSYTASADSRLKAIADSQRKRELEWQREREAVSTEIEEASSSQVIVIDSDNEERKAGDVNYEAATDNNIQINQEDLDVWCEEAASYKQRSSTSGARPIRASKEIKLPTAKVQLLQDRAQEVSNKPRRSAIPSPWRRGENVEDESSYLTSADMTGLFHHDPKTKIKFGAAEVDRQKRQYSSGSFDVDRMSGTPRRPVVGRDGSEDSIESTETEESDARQLQTELSFNQVHVDETADVSNVLSHETLSEPSMPQDAEFEQVETVTDFTEAELSFSLLPQPVKIPVNFNDSTVSNIAPCLVRSFTSTAPEPSRPSTPRSALKGARQSVGLEDANPPAVRKVIFSAHETRVDTEGQEEEASVQSVSSSPEIEIRHNFKEEGSVPVGEVKEDSPGHKSGLLGWLWSGSKKSNDQPSMSIDGADDQQQRCIKAQPSTAGVPPRTPSYLLPPSYPSDPSRDTKLPMPTTGNFTDTHFRTLHIIYAKSLRPRFHAPRADEVRPALRNLLGAAFEADESKCGLGIFEWTVDEPALRVLERFMQEIECGYHAGSEVKWGWAEREICERLFRIVVGDEVRKEERAVTEKAA